MAGDFNFGEVILQTLQNEDRLRLQREGQIDERTFRTATIANEQRRLAQGDEAQRLQQEQFNKSLAEQVRQNPDIMPGEYLDLLGFGVEQKKQIADAVMKSDTLASRHNNPLNIKYGGFAKKYGAQEGEKAQDGGSFAKFPTVDTGLAAASDLLTSSSYRGLSVDQALKRWSNKGYGDEIAPEFKGKQIGDLSDEQIDTLVNKMAVREGSVSAGVNIGGTTIKSSSDFLNHPMPFKVVGGIIDDLLKKEDFGLKKLQTEAYNDLRLATLNKQKKGDEREARSLEFSTKYIKASMGNVGGISAKDLVVPQSPLSGIMKAIFTPGGTKGYSSIPGYSGMDIGGLLDLVTSPLKADIKGAQQANYKIVGPSVQPTLDQADLALAGTTDIGVDDPRVSAAASESVQGLSNLLGLEDQGFVKLSDSERKAIIDKASRLVTILHYDQSMVNRRIKEKVQEQYQIDYNRGKTYDQLLQNEK